MGTELNCSKIRMLNIFNLKHHSHIAKYIKVGTYTILSMMIDAQTTG